MLNRDCVYLSVPIRVLLSPIFVCEERVERQSCRAIGQADLKLNHVIIQILLPQPPKAGMTGLAGLPSHNIQQLLSCSAFSNLCPGMQARVCVCVCVPSSPALLTKEATGPQQDGMSGTTESNFLMY